MDCGFCGMPLGSALIVWEAGDPFCSEECRLDRDLDRVAWAAARAAGRRRDHALCGIRPCNDCA